MSKRASSEKQHVVPKFLLRGFVDRRLGQLFVYDKSTSRVFAQSPERAARHGGFYDLQAEVGTLTLEKSLADLESRAGSIIGRVLRERSLSSLDSEDAEQLALFAAVQMFRTDNVRRKAMQMSADLAEWANGFATQWGATSDLKPLSEDDAKALSLDYLAHAHEIAPHFLDKAWILLAPPEGQHFITSDNPVTLHNTVDHGWRGNLGLAVRGIEIYLPLSQDLTLSFMCPSHVDSVLTGMDKAEELKKANPALRGRIEHLSEGPAEMLAAFQKGTPWVGVTDNVTFVNHLQVKNAERFLYGPSRDFILADEMLRDHPTLRTGPRMAVNGAGKRRLNSRGDR